jgi:uncharacterized protein involved in exopolysaccharide biosynthesis
MLSFFRRQFGRLPAAQRWLLRTAGWALTGLAAGFLISFLLPASYTSEATLRLVPAMISQDLVPHDTVDFGRLLASQKTTVLSRNVITTIINNLDLYPSDRKREPMEDVIEEFLKVVRIDSSGEKLIRVAFTYPEPVLANKVTQDLVSRIIAQMLTQQSNMSAESVQFFKDEVDQLGNSWLKLSASVKATPASDPGYELLVLARDQKRREYESMAQKLATAEILKDLANRGQDTRLELLDAASLPQEPDTPPTVVGLIGLGCGLAVGLFMALWRALCQTTPGFSVPGAAEPA